MDREVSRGLEDLLDEVARAQDAELATTDDVERARADALAGVAEPRHERRGRVAIAAAAAVAVAAAALLAVWAAGDAPLTYETGGEPGEMGRFIAAADDAPLPITFSDGSAAVLAPGARARVLDADARGSHVLLESGTATVSVAHDGDTDWRFEVGPFDVHVTGTRFTIEWDPDAQRFAIELHEGSVAVSGPLVGERAVHAGELMRVSVTEDAFELVRVGDDEGEPEVAVVTPDGPADEPETTRETPAEEPGATDTGGELLRRRLPAEPSTDAPPTVPAWLEHARAGRYDEAAATARLAGVDAIVAEAPPQDLLLLGDASRLAREVGLAARAYEAARDRAPNTNPAAAAAFGLGRTHFDRGAYAAAARWFDTYLAEAPEGHLAREALGRLFESRLRAGDEAGASDAARRYVDRYPDGPYADLARRHLGR